MAFPGPEASRTTDSATARRTATFTPSFESWPWRKPLFGEYRRGSRVQHQDRSGTRHSLWVQSVRTVVFHFKGFLSASTEEIHAKRKKHRGWSENFKGKTPKSWSSAQSAQSETKKTMPWGAVPVEPADTMSPSECNRPAIGTPVRKAPGPGGLAPSFPKFGKTVFLRLNMIKLHFGSFWGDKLRGHPIDHTSILAGCVLFRLHSTVRASQVKPGALTWVQVEHPELFPSWVIRQSWVCHYQKKIGPFTSTNLYHGSWTAMTKTIRSLRQLFRGWHTLRTRFR